MLSKINMKLGIALILVITGVLSFNILAHFLSPQPIQASNDRSTMRALFERVNQQINDNDGFLVSIKFVTPLIEDEETWLIPDRRSEDEVSIAISEIGDEYVCFDTLRGAARFLQCTPYSNIAGIRYLIN